MTSGITIDGQFIGVTWHTADVYFQVVRKIIDSGESRVLRITADDGSLLSVLVTSTSRLSSHVSGEEIREQGGADFSKLPFGNFPVLLREYLDPDDALWDLVYKTDLGAAVRDLDD